MLLPLTNYGVKSMSMGYLLPASDENAPVVWRGLMVMKAIQQLLHEVEWGGLDILVLDLPPGTGDTQLTISQQVVLDGMFYLFLSLRAQMGSGVNNKGLAGAIIVSTPQDIALKDTLKGIGMFRKVSVPILGMVQNMSIFTCPNCAHKTPIFGARHGGGVERACEREGIEFLGDVPLHRGICDDADRGVPTVVSEPESERGRLFTELARRVGVTVEL